MISELKTLADAAQPTVFHRLLKRLDDEGRLLRVYTQNIDNLEERAGLSFGLGETGDSTTTARALGKRKRDEKARAAATSGKQDLGKGAPVGVRAQWGRSVSDSALLKSHQERFESLTPEPSSTTPMFPRTIPLHGSLSALTCSVCTYKLYLSPPTLESAPDSVAGSSTRRQSPGAPEREADRVQALAMLAAGEPVPCSKCADYEEVRAVAGLRSRGVGIMKVGVVLYGGQNEGAEQVGECLQRDILGLRDPNEPAVPETAAERKARERKAKKEADKVASSIEPVKSLPFTPGGLQPIVEIGGDEAFAAAFNDPDDAAAEAELLLPSSSLAAKPAQVRAARVPRLKPLPPDLLIVAGTSLKVPGTKRIVREFAKACRARDHRVYSDESDDEEDADGSRISPRPRRGAAGRRSTRSRSAGADSAESGSGDEPDESDEDEDINAPIRSILLNYDFPGPSREWEDVFDVWVQGDVQRAALGLWEASAYPVTETHVRSMAPGTAGASLEQYSWASSMAYLESERIREKREARSAARRANSPGASSATSSAARRGKAAVAKDTALPNSKARRTKLEQSPSTATQSPSASPSPTKKPRASGPAKKRAAGKAATDSEAAPSLKSGRKASAVEGEAQSKPTSRAFSRSKSSSHAETAAQPAAARRRLAAVRRNSVSNAPSVVLDNGLARAYAGTKGGAGSTGERARRIIKLE
jgi:NAD-dependent SIR2 family protein deacetylase